jgi:hypothetical protein
VIGTCTSKNGRTPTIHIIDTMINAIAALVSIALAHDLQPQRVSSDGSRCCTMNR